MPVVLTREPHNPHDPNAVAVYIEVARLGGILGRSLKQIGYIKASTAKSLAKAMDCGAKVAGHVKSFWAPDDREFPRVTLEITDEIYLCVGAVRDAFERARRRCADGNRAFGAPAAPRAAR